MITRESDIRAGVRQYWIADPASRTVELLTLRDDGYEPVAIDTGAAIISSLVISGWDIATGALFG